MLCVAQHVYAVETCSAYLHPQCVLCMLGTWEGYAKLGIEYAARASRMGVL